MKGVCVCASMKVVDAVTAMFGDDHALIYLLDDVGQMTVETFISNPSVAEYERKCTIVSKHYDDYKAFREACKHAVADADVAETTLVIAKPDAMRQRLGFLLIARLECNAVLEVVGLRYGTFSRELFAKHYGEHVGKPFYEDLLTRMSSGVCAVAAIRGKDAVRQARAYVLQQRESYGVTGKPENLLHASDSVDAAKREIALWFPEI